MGENIKEFLNQTGELAMQIGVHLPPPPATTDEAIIAIGLRAKVGEATSEDCKTIFADLMDLRSRFALLNEACADYDSQVAWLLEQIEAMNGKQGFVYLPGLEHQRNSLQQTRVIVANVLNAGVEGLFKGK